MEFELAFQYVNEGIEWEARRLGLAFGIDNVLKRKDVDGSYIGFVGDIMVTFHVTSTYLLADIFVAEGRGVKFKCRASRNSTFEWEVSSGGSTIIRETMAQALYRLGDKNEDALSRLPQLSTHEKLELRLSMPREFWPQKWLDEETSK